MSMYQRGKTWWADIYTVQGRERVSLRTTNKQTAAKRYAEMFDAATREKAGLSVRNKNPQGLTLAEAVRQYLDSPKAKKQKQHDKLAYTLDKHIIRDPIGAMRLEDIGRGDVVKWMDRREAAGASAATCNRLRSNLSAVFSSLIEREDFHGDHPVRMVRRHAETTPKARLLPPTAVIPLIEHAPTKHWQVALALAAYAGLRRGEIERLRWQDVDLVGRILTVQISKTGVRRIVGVHPELVDLLTQAKGDASESERVVPYAGWPKSAVIVRNALKRAGVEVPDSVQACFHSLRHTWATQLAECGADPFIVKFMGWGPPPGDVMARSYMKPRAVLISEVDKLKYPRSNA